MRTNLPALSVAWLAALGLAGCGLRLATPSGEAQAGSVAAHEVEQSVGLVRSPSLEAYVGAVGQRLAGLPDVRHVEGGFAFQVVDMAVPNAFALPGGHVYVSRGLLVLMNHEDELANALAHEVAHVSRRHHLKHSLRQTPFVPVRLAGGIAAGAVRLVAWPLGRLGAPLRPVGDAFAVLGSAPGSLLLAGHSRSQEIEADAVGQRLAAEAGWDPDGMTRLMEALVRDVARRGGDPEARSFLDTHPTSPDRELRTRARSAELSVADLPPVAPSRLRFLAALDGLLVGPPARDGVVDGRAFLHAGLDLRLEFPEGWTIANGVHNVTASPPGDDAEREVFVSLSLAGRGEDPAEAARSVIARHDVELLEGPRETPIHGLAAVSAEGRERRVRSPYRVRATWIAHRGVILQVVGAAPDEQWARWGPALSRVATTLRPLEPVDHGRIVEARLRIVEGLPGGNFGTLIARFDTPWDVAAVAAANALPEDTRFETRTPLKLAVREVYRP